MAGGQRDDAVGADRGWMHAGRCKNLSRPWMPLYIADYLRDTRHLNAAEHGAYLLLIMQYWTAGTLPNDDQRLARITCTSEAEWKKIRPIIEPFFEPGWRHKRIDGELARSSEISS